MHAMAGSRHLFGQQELSKYRSVFDIFDANNDGLISPADVDIVLRRTGRHYSGREIKTLFREVDEDGDGAITWDEFLGLLAKQRLRIQDTFNEYDENGDGVITEDEIKRTLRANGERGTSKKAKETLKAADKNHDGRVDFKEFERMISRDEAIACATRENFGDGLIDFANLVRLVSKTENIMKDVKRADKPKRSEKQCTSSHKPDKSKPSKEAGPVDDLQARLTKTFKMYDRDGDGLVSRHEIKQTLKEHGLSDSVSSYQAKEIIKTADTNGDGLVNYKEFMKAMTKKETMGSGSAPRRKVEDTKRSSTKAVPTTEDARLLKAFRQYDKDGDGFISKKELKQTLQEHGMCNSSTSSYQAKEMMKNADLDGDGMISIEEFKQMMKK